MVELTNAGFGFVIGCMLLMGAAIGAGVLAIWRELLEDDWRDLQ